MHSILSTDSIIFGLYLCGVTICTRAFQTPNRKSQIISQIIERTNPPADVKPYLSDKLQGLSVLYLQSLNTALQPSVGGAPNKSLASIIRQPYLIPTTSLVDWIWKGQEHFACKTFPRTFMKNYTDSNAEMFIRELEKFCNAEDGNQRKVAREMKKVLKRSAGTIQNPKEVEEQFMRPLSKALRIPFGGQKRTSHHPEREKPTPIMDDANRDDSKKGSKTRTVAKLVTEITDKLPLSVKAKSWWMENGKKYTPEALRKLLELLNGSSGPFYVELSSQPVILHMMPPNWFTLDRDKIILVLISKVAEKLISRGEQILAGTMIMLFGSIFQGIDDATFVKRVVEVMSNHVPSAKDIEPIAMAWITSIQKISYEHSLSKKPKTPVV